MKNTKIYCLILFVIGAISMNNAQSQSESSLFGLKMGAGVYSFTGGELQNPTPLLGYVAGIYVHDPLEDTNTDFRNRPGESNV